MPRNMEDIIFPINEEPETLRDFNRYPRDSVWVIHKNTIALPAGTRRGKCRTPEATKNIQARYWETGIPLGLELELEMDGYGECYGDDCCEECYDGYCCGCNSERALNSDEVTNILRKSRG